MHRYPDWDARLAAYLEGARSLEYAYGVHDCCLFSAGAVKAMTGVDPMKEFRGKYSSKRGSQLALARIGAGSLGATLDTKFERIEPAFAHRGDIVMHAGAIGICIGDRAIMAGAEGEREGLVLVERSVWESPLAWRVPY